MQPAVHGANAKFTTGNAHGPKTDCDPRWTGTYDLTRTGHGICVGRATAGTEVRFIRITEEPIEVWTDDLCVAPGQVGEIVVSGRAVTREYFGLPQATAASKIRVGDTIWHRMGDVGHLDADERIWFCGRKAHRVETESGTMFSVCCEAIFLEHPEVSRCALVGVGPRVRQTPVVVVELGSGKIPRSKERARLVGELRALAAANERTLMIKRFLFHRSLPVDVRHNAKINREALAVWATRQVATQAGESR
jgi:acyl-CoA synthetase (AMP-forming)/AMP-acid ligase II